MLGKFRRFMKGRRGQGMSEYIIMVGLIAICCIAIYQLFGQQIRYTMTSIGDQLAGNTAATTTSMNSTMTAESGKKKNLKDFQNQ